MGAGTALRFLQNTRRGVGGREIVATRGHSRITSIIDTAEKKWTRQRRAEWESR